MAEQFLRFEYISYPLWRRQQPDWLRPFSDAFYSQFYPVAADRRPPASPAEMAKFLSQWKILGGGETDFVDVRTLERGLEQSEAQLSIAEVQKAPPLFEGCLRIPAQWEPIEKILISWCIMYPPLWEMHAQMAEAISPVANVEIFVPTEMWAHAVWLYLHWREKAHMENICLTVLPTNDIWIRDYGPVVGHDRDGKLAAVNMIYDPLPEYPQQDDNGMPSRWAAHYGIPTRDLPLHNEGGNIWSDGQGTLLMSEQVLYSNRYHDRHSLEKLLHTMIDYEKLIITPRLTLEETGHIDMLVKLIDSETILVSAAESPTTNTVLRKVRRQFERETNAAGKRYHVVEVTTPPLYLNWFLYSIRRGYTNSLTVNGRILVPTFGLPHDEAVLQLYARVMPEYTVIPIDSKIGINGGGAVHCMTKEVPKTLP